MLKGKQRFILLVALLFVVSSILSACGGNGATTAPGGDPTGPTASNPIRMTMATSWPQGILLHDIPEKFAEEVRRVSGGRLVIDVQPSGAIVGPGEVLDATAQRSIDMYQSFSGYWLGKTPLAPFFSSVPMTMEAAMYLVWIYEGGGWELWQRAYDEMGYSNVKVIPLGITHPEILAWSNVPLTRIEEWSGLKYRTVGWWGEILMEHDVAVTSLPAAELYPSLERGILDALEFSTPFTDKSLAFYEVSDYFTGPGMHQPSVLFELGFNMDSWNSLPEDLQEIVLTCARSTTLWGWTTDIWKGMETLDYYEGQGVEAVQVAPEVQRAFAQTTHDLLDARSAELGGLFEEVWTSIKTFQNRFYDYEEFMVPIRVRAN